MNGETNTHHITLFFLCDTEWTWVTVKVLMAQIAMQSV